MSGRWLVTWSVVAVVLGPAPGVVRADASSAQSDSYRPTRVSADLWRELGRPGARRADELTERALAHAREGMRHMPSDWPGVCRRARDLRLASDSEAAMRGRARALQHLLHQTMHRRAFLDNALERLTRAQRLDPHNPRTAHALATVLSSWEEPGPLWECSARRRDAEAIAALQALRALHPDYRSSEIAFELGVLYTRDKQFEAAAAAYADALALSLDERESPSTRANLAEVTMLSGKLELALEHYLRALALDNDYRHYTLTLFGMAVTLDRLGEHERALDHVRKALGGDRDRMRILRSDGVFFVPDHEVHYYEALAYEALAASQAEDGVDPTQALRAAADSLRAYLQAAPPEDRFRSATEDNLARIDGALGAAQKPRRTK